MAVKIEEYDADDSYMAEYDPWMDPHADFPTTTTTTTSATQCQRICRRVCRTKPDSASPSPVKTRKLILSRSIIMYFKQLGDFTAHIY